MAAITAFTGTLPSKSQPPTEFNANVTAFLAYIAGLGPEINTAIAEILVGASVSVWAVGTTYSAPTIVAGSNGIRYACVGTDVLADNPVTSVTGNWVPLTFDSTTLFPVVSATVPIKNDIRGGDVTVSGNVLTITPCSCMDSTGKIALYTSVNKTVTLASTINQDFYVFQVRKVSDASVEFRAYTTMAGAAADTAINAFRFVGFAKNDGSGVTMPFYQFGDIVSWHSSVMPIITATTTTSLVSYSVSAVIPSGVASKIKIVLSSVETLTVSYNGTNEISSYNALNYSPVEILPVSAIYLKTTTASAPVKVRGISLRR